MSTHARNLHMMAQLTKTVLLVMEKCNLILWGITFLNFSSLRSDFTPWILNSFFLACVLSGHNTIHMTDHLLADGPYLAQHHTDTKWHYFIKCTKTQRWKQMDGIQKKGRQHSSVWQAAVSANHQATQCQKRKASQWRRKSRSEMKAISKC